MLKMLGAKMDGSIGIEFYATYAPPTLEDALPIGAAAE